MSAPDTLFMQDKPAHGGCPAVPGSASPKREMGMMEWYATEGGRKCPMCGQYAKAETLGNLSFYTAPPTVARITMFGHLPGYGCNQSAQNAKAHPRTNEQP